MQSGKLLVDLLENQFFSYKELRRKVQNLWIFESF